jgi:hypothetical protein
MFLNDEPKVAVPVGVVIVETPGAVEHGVSPGATAGSVEAEQVTTEREKTRSESALE